jgi:hypothetical protein
VKLNVIANDGVSGGWSILESGDAFDIEGHHFEFRLLEDLAEPSVDVPNILRDDTNIGQGTAPTPQTPASERSKIVQLADAQASDQTDKPGMSGRPLRLSELMPRDEGGFPPEEAAS